MSSLFKDVYPDGTVKYHDNDRIICAETNGPDVYFTNNFISRIVEETIGEITMPYFPESKPIKVFVREFLVDPKFGDYDTLGIHYLYHAGKKIQIGRYFKEGESGLEEITIDEYLSRAEKMVKS